MRMTNFINEVFWNYKIEKWNEKKESLENYRSFNKITECRIAYNNILKNEKGIFRLIKLLEINER